MKAHSLIDLYFPASAGTPEEAAEAAKNSGIDAVVYVADRPEELPDGEGITSINANDGPKVHPACLVVGPGYRLAALLVDWNTPSAYEVLEATEDLGLIHQAIDELGGAAVPLCPRQGPDGDVVRKVADLPAANQVGIVALVTGGSPIARDLDIEDASIGRRRVLGGTGPFGELADCGRFCTVLPVDPTDAGDLIARLNEGFGVAVEIPPPAAAGQDPDKQKKKKRRRRRRRRKPREDDGGPPQDGQQRRRARPPRGEDKAPPEPEAEPDPTEPPAED